MKKLWLFCTLISMSLFLKAQSVTDYEKLLTSETSQSWKLDSFKLKFSNRLSKGNLLSFKLANKRVILNTNNKNDTLKWSIQLQNQPLLAILRIGHLYEFEIDFIQRENIIYMRLRDRPYGTKLIQFNEYFFIKAN
jgi:hypothetical protein